MEENLFESPTYSPASFHSSLHGAQEMVCVHSACMVHGAAVTPYLYSMKDMWGLDFSQFKYFVRTNTCDVCIMYCENGVYWLLSLHVFHRSFGIATCTYTYYISTCSLHVAKCVNDPTKACHSELKSLLRTYQHLYFCACTYIYKISLLCQICTYMYMYVHTYGHVHAIFYNTCL